MPPLNLRPIPTTTPKQHPPPTLPTWTFNYAPSHDGKESNLLLMLHGLGDTSKPFFELGKQFKLPATCVLSLQAPFPVPLMETPSYTWTPLSPSDFLSDTPPPTSLQSITQRTLPLLLDLLDHLTTACGWAAERIHLFGWGQAGTVVVELARALGLRAQGERLGSAVSICGPLLSTPALNTSLSLPTPVLYFARTSSSSQSQLLKRTFKPDGLTIVTCPGPEGAMPRGAEEWTHVMRFWSGVLVRDDWMRGAGGKDGEVYEVVP